VTNDGRQTDNGPNGSLMVGSDWNGRSLVETVMPRGILSSRARPELQLFTLEAFNCLGGFEGPFSYAKIAGELEYFGWRGRRADYWLEKAQEQGWLEPIRQSDHAFSHIRRFKFTNLIRPASPQQRWLFDPHAPPSFSGNLRTVVRLTMPVLILASNEHSVTSKQLQWYYRFVGDWEEGVAILTAKDFRRVFNRDDRRFREIVKEWKDRDTIKILEQTRGRLVVQWLTPGYLPDAVEELQEIRNADPQNIPAELCTLLEEPWLRNGRRGIIVPVRHIGADRAGSAPDEAGQTGGVGAQIAPVQPRTRQHKPAELAQIAPVQPRTRQDKPAELAQIAPVQPGTRQHKPAELAQIAPVHGALMIMIMNMDFIKSMTMTWAIDPNTPGLAQASRMSRFARPFGKASRRGRCIGFTRKPSS